MNAHLVTIATMQADHREWLAAHARWRHDVARWQTEHELAITRLAELQHTVQKHGASLTDFLRSLGQTDEALATHEEEIAASRESGEDQTPEDVLANRHIEQAFRFDQERNAHERIEQHHAAVMAQLKSLEASAAAPM
jgi:hypothetical protein